MSYKDGVLTIADFQKGQVKHPIYGFGLLKNVEIFENQGIAKLKNRSYLDDSISPNQTPIAEVYDNYGNTYTMTGYSGTGNIYKNGTAIQSSLANCWDMKIYKDYLWVRHSSVMSCYGPLNSAPQWFSNVDTGFETVYNGCLLVGQDDYLYSGNGNRVAKIEVLTSGTAGVAPTLSSNKTALDLKDGQYVSCLEEYGTKIVVGTHGGASYYDRGNYPIARLYSWNRQLGTLGNPGLADLPVIFNGENGVNAIKQHANKLYVSAGTQGNIYVTDATNYVKIAELPYTPVGVNYNSTVLLNALNISSKGNLLVGLSGTWADITRPGIYEVNLNSKNEVSYRTVSGQTTVPSINDGVVVYIGFVNPKSSTVTKTGWSKGATYGVDTSDFTMYSSYGGVIETPLYRVGTYDNKKTFERIEFSLASPLVTGQNIRISYRLNDTDDWTTVGTWGYTTFNEDNIVSFSDTAGITDAELIQLKIELDQALTTLYGRNINLVSLTLR